ncbi:MAG: hypothetical protein ABF651_05685 [Sporolactobacillus sp.]
MLCFSTVVPGFSTTLEAHAAAQSTDINSHSGDVDLQSTTPINTIINDTTPVTSETDIHAVGMDKNGNVIDITPNLLSQKISPLAASGKAKELGSITLSKKQTKDLASNMKKAHVDQYHLLVELFSVFGGIPGGLTTLAIELSADAQFKPVVIKAAKEGKRVKIKIMDSSPHTSYSEYVIYSIVS